MTGHAPAPDQAARDSARTDLTTNFLVEAGAGSGKTTLLADRMAALVEAGIPTRQLAAVTFTRKAAGELRERFQLALEKALAKARASGGAAEHLARLQAALDHIDEAFLGTIHAFCARLLRERPLEAGLDPRFREVEPEEADDLREAWWRGWLEQQHLSGAADLSRMLELGIEPEQLAQAFGIFDRYPDVDFSSREVPAPDVGPVRGRLEQFLDRARKLVPREEPPGGWDELQHTVRQLQFARRGEAWGTTPGFCDALAGIGASKVTQNRWVTGGGDDKQEKAAAKALGEEFERLKAGEIEPLLHQWRAHRYPGVVRLLQRAAASFAEHRVKEGALGFEDLLLHAARLLRENADARRALGERFRHVLVDEFQDTDPVQAEVLFLLASDPALDAADPSWIAATLRPGALFVVGDPKQSIYRFRRADITTYAAAREALERRGQVLALTANFRSVPPVAAFVNAHFGAGGAFPVEQTPQQARFAPMEPVRGPTASGGVFQYDIVGENARPAKAWIHQQDAKRVGSFIQARVQSGERKPEEFLVLCRERKALAAYARELAQRNIPASVSGAETGYATELHELQLLLQALADPTNAILAVAALEGVFVGATPADLWAAKEAGLAFDLAAAPPAPGDDESPRVARVRAGLDRLRGWLVTSRRVAPDELLETILDESGLLARTAGGDLGDQRAGLLLDLVSRVRAATLDGAGGADTALLALDRLLTDEAPEASLRPGRTDAVRVMNLHKAKGLEAAVVILAAPTEQKDHPPKVAVRREGSVATGGLLVEFKNGRTTTRLAEPDDWDAQAAAETAFLDAEEDRLMYVAATRAKDELVVARLFKTPARKAPELADRTIWARLQPSLLNHATDLSIGVTSAPGRERLEERGPEIARRAGETDGGRRDAAVPGFRFRTVSRIAHVDAAAHGEQASGDAAGDAAGDAGRGGGASGTSAGAAWGRAVHRLLEWLGHGGDAAALEARAAAIASAERRETPLDAAALLRLVRQVLKRDEWAALSAAPERVSEFTLMEWRTDGHAVPRLVEGVIDAAYRGADGWTVIDWKTDMDDAAWEQRQGQYQAQVDQYAEMLARATGTKAKGVLVRLVDGAT